MSFKVTSNMFTTDGFHKHPHWQGPNYNIEPKNEYITRLIRNKENKTKTIVENSKKEEKVKPLLRNASSVISANQSDLSQHDYL